MKLINLIDQLNSVFVSDVNECETTGMCLNGVCKNMMGMYKCLCDKEKGFMPNSNETGCIGKPSSPDLNISPPRPPSRVIFLFPLMKLDAKV